MQRIIAKADYELYEELFVNGNLEKAKKLWEQIAKNTAFLNGASQIVNHNGEKRFQGPMICLMILKYFYTIPEDIYQKLIKEFFLNPDLISSIITDNGKRIDYLSLILENSEYKLDKFQKSIIMSKVHQNNGLLDNEISIRYHEIPSLTSPIEASFTSGDIEINVTQHEAPILESGQYITYGKIVIPSIYDYRYAITKNSNFTVSEKDEAFDRILKDYEEFKEFVNYQLVYLYSKYVSHNELSLEELKTLPLEEIALRLKSGQELSSKVAKVRQMVKNRLSEGPKL